MEMFHGRAAIIQEFIQGSFETERRVARIQPTVPPKPFQKGSLNRVPASAGVTAGMSPLRLYI